MREVVFVEEWAFVDGRELVSFCGVQSCPSCSSFGYVSLGQCQVLGACQPKKRFLPPGAQLLRRCEHWSHLRHGPLLYQNENGYPSCAALSIRRSALVSPLPSPKQRAAFFSAWHLIHLPDERT